MEVKKEKDLIIQGFKECLLWSKDFELGFDYDFTLNAQTKINNIVDRFIELSELELCSYNNFNYSLLTCTLFEYIGHDIYCTLNGLGVGFWDRPDVYLNDLHTKFNSVIETMIASKEFYVSDIFIDAEGLLSIE